MKGAVPEMGFVFLDFDGTLVNSQRRLYGLFCRLCRECGMSYDEYWAVKRGRMTQAKMLREYFGYDDEAVRRFHEIWIDHVEDEDLVETDVPVVGMSDFLERQSGRHVLYLLTARQNPSLVRRQVRKFGWEPFFRDLIVTRGKCDKDVAVLEKVGHVGYGVLIGDTGEDVRAAHRLGFRSVAVGWGILSPEVLAEYKPDFLAERIEDLDSCPFI